LIEGIITGAALLILIFVVFAKLFNVAKGGHQYQGLFILGGFALALLCWFLVLTSFAAALQFQDTITSGSDTYTVTSNEAVQLSFYLPLANVLVLLSTLLTFIEAVLLFSKGVIQPKMSRQG